MKETLTKKQLCRLLNWSERTIDRKVNAGKMPAPRRPDPDSRTLLWLSEEIHKWMNNWPKKGGKS